MAGSGADGRRLTPTLGRHATSLALVLIVAACGSTSPAATGSASDPTEPSSPAPAASPDSSTPASTAPEATADTGAPAAGDAAPTDTSIDVDLDDICANLDPVDVASIMGVASMRASTIPRGCVWSGGGAPTIGIGVVTTDGADASPDADCAARSEAYAEVLPTTVNGLPGFTGIDQGSTGFTLQVCAPTFVLTIGADDTTRTALEDLGDRFLS